VTRLKFVMFAIVTCSLIGCVSPQFVRTGHESIVELPPTMSDSVEIYRSTKPPWEYSELGMITLRGISDVQLIFKKFRVEAAKRGANAIVNFDLDSEAKDVSVSETKSDSEGNAFTVYKTERQVTYIASGTLVRKIKEK
jgi:hypothetical protein